MVWSSLEPDEKTVARLEANVRRASRREDFMSWASNALRITASVAALILFGVSVGWMGHDRYQGVPVVPHASPSSVANVADTGGGGSGVATKYNVYLYDHGKLASIQQFNTLEEAQQFKHDFEAAQSSPNGSDWSVVPATNKF
jgi:hypothetical protein